VTLWPRFKHYFAYLMKNWIKISLIFAFLSFSLAGMAQKQRFPKPDFGSGYSQPTPVTPEPRALALEYTDVVVLLIVLSLASWFAIRKRSRRGLLWLSVFTLIYFGFYCNGCICSIGSVQNVVLTLFDPVYAISITTLLFFLLPLIFALYFGRIFCAGACPLGAMQDLLIVKPLPLPEWFRKTLGIIPYVYLTLAVLFAATGTDFIICRYDPFVGIFRMDAKFLMVVLGIAFLLTGMFVARPYCRFLCPYGVLLNWMSRFSKWHLSITPAECIQCKLCSDSCPFDAIDYPTEKQSKETKWGVNRFLVYALMIPLWIFIGGFAGSKAHTWISKANSTVYLTELLLSKPEVRFDQKNLDVQAFLSSGKSMETLVKEATVIRRKFYTGGWFSGGFIGLVIGMTLLGQVVYRRKTDYQPNKGNCFSCGRCMNYCPVKKVTR
jgi:NosR/NirI family transcriptional regulator, nitrous oxide reductase regulator